MSARRGELVVAAAALLTTLPFASKAFHIDDAAYIERAEGGTALDAPGQRVERFGSRLVLTGRPRDAVGRWPPNVEKSEHPENLENFFS